MKKKFISLAIAASLSSGFLAPSFVLASDVKDGEVLNGTTFTENTHNALHGGVTHDNTYQSHATEDLWQSRTVHRPTSDSYSNKFKDESQQQVIDGRSYNNEFSGNAHQRVAGHGHSHANKFSGKSSQLVEPGDSTNDEFHDDSTQTISYGGKSYGGVFHDKSQMILKDAFASQASFHEQSGLDVSPEKKTILQV